MRVRLFVLFLTTALCALANGQGASDGNDFYLGLLYPSYNTVSAQASNYTVVALVSSLEDNTISVSYFDPVSGIEEAPMTYKVTALNSVSIPLNISKMKIAQSEVGEYRSVHIRGKKKISVQYFSSGASSGGAYLGLPSNVLGRKYVVASYNDNPDGIGALVGGEAPSSYDIGCGEFVVIGTEYGTSVTITMRSESQGGIKAGDSKTISLNRGECYLVRSKCSSNDADISGSIVESNHPVAVISGHSNAALGSVGDHVVESRDFMIEQMIPAEYWDTTGYTGIPFLNASPYTADGVGDSYRVYSYDTAANIVKMNGNIDMTSSRLNPREKFDVEAATSFSSVNNKRFMVVQYDQASQGDKDPHPRPSMMQLVPQSRCRKTYHLTVPAKTFERSQSDYLWISPEPSFVSVSKNGAPPVPFSKAGFQKVFTSATTPGVVYKVTPGSYVITNEYPFANMLIYQYGYRMMSADVSAGDEDGDDSYTSYAMPAGIQLPYADTANITVDVEEICGGWNVCVTDNRIEGGISAVVMADDPYGDIFPYDPTKRGPYQYYNVSFTPDIDPNGTREVFFRDKPEKVCFTIYADNLNKNGYAPFVLHDNVGHEKIVELYYKKRVVSFKPDFSIDDYYPSYYGTQLIKKSADSIIMVINHTTSGQNVAINSVRMKDAKTLTISSINRTLPTLLLPGDTMKISVRFTPQDTGYFRDTLSVIADCFTKTFIMNGYGAVGLIAASDHNFGKLAVDKKSCWDTITVRNTGRLPFTLKENYLLTDTVNFSFDPSSIRVGNRNYPLPIVIPAGGLVKLYICYHPTTLGEHSAELVLQTDIPAPYTTKIKNVIKLKGTGTSSTKVIEELQLGELRIHPNPTLGEDITASFGLAEPRELRFAVYDMLGREVLSITPSYFAKGKQSVMLPVSKLGEGGYILRVSDGVLTKSISFRVVK